ncbi:MAG: hypothetical protein LQ346_003561 [Caloplaca aetnensis]|nr:MAG: hypothetical protein LQ346_003561 [Caloplaca aetnensis]
MTVATTATAATATTPPHPKPKPTDLPCLLCLHGGGTSAAIFSIQTGRLRRALAKHFRFVFVDGPFECPAGPGVLPFFQGMGPYRRWISEDGDEEGKVRPLLQKTMADDGGTFVGVLGFSQGARLALGLLHEKQEKHPEALDSFGFGVFICGTYPPLGMGSALFPVTPAAQFESQYWDAKHERIIDVPSIHVIGQRDPYARKSRLLARCSEPESATVMEFGMGHHLPTAPAETQRLAERMVVLLRDHQQQQQREVEERKAEVEVVGKRASSQVEVMEIAVQA